jgi:hypothetical protein
MSDEKSQIEKVETLYCIIESELENANAQLSLFKKDNVNFILLILALIGLLAFIPLDIFAYNWFVNGLYVTLICTLMIVFFSFLFYRDMNKKKNPSETKASQQQCATCDSKQLCTTEDDQILEGRRKSKDFLLIEIIGRLFPALIYSGYFFLLTSFIAYFYLITTDPGKKIPSLIQSDPYLVFLLFIMVAVYWNYQRNIDHHLKLHSFKEYLKKQLKNSIVIVILGVITLAYGFLVKLPAFISISETSQFSSTIIAHSMNVPQFPLELIQGLYTLVLLLVFVEFILSSFYVESLNRKIIELLGLKRQINRYQLGVISELDIERIVRILPNLYINPPRFLTIYGVITVPIPFELNQCADVLYLVPDEMTVKRI